MEKIKTEKDLFDKINLFDKLKKASFEEGIKIMTSKNIIEQATLFINSLKNIINYNGEIISPKIFLSSYFIYHFHDIALNENENKNEIEIFIYQESIKIVKLTNNLTINNKIDIIKYISELNKYKNHFDNWKKNDLSSQIEIYSLLFLKHQNEPNKLNKIKKQLELLVGKKNIELIITDIENINILRENEIKNTLKNIFWSNFFHEISNQNYQQFNYILKDIRDYFNLITKNKKQYFNEYLDIEFLNTHIQNNNLNLIFETIKFCLIELKKLDAPIFDYINEEMQNYIFNEKNVTIILSFLIDRLENIHSAINLFIS